MAHGDVERHSANDGGFPVGLAKHVRQSVCRLVSAVEERLCYADIDERPSDVHGWMGMDWAVPLGLRLVWPFGRPWKKRLQRCFSSAIGPFLRVCILGHVQSPHARLDAVACSARLYGLVSLQTAVEGLAVVSTACRCFCGFVRLSISAEG